MIAWTEMLRNLPHENVSITSYDGLTLRGKYYEYKKGAPMEIMFHGYKGNSERDLCGGVQRSFSVGRNALIVDQRASGQSDGHVITFGIKERRDVHSWVDFAISHFGKDVKIVITGISMGAATVMMATADPLPDNVVTVLADCGFTSPKEIICKVIKDMKLPPKLVYPFIRLGARLYGGFDLEETSALQAVKTNKIPLILAHGESDDFVPCEMSRTLFDNCVAEKKKLITVHNAGHGLAYLVAGDSYVEDLKSFQAECGF
jgi:fermentation-respiration switch protein FrsA (DUF1100 family)